MVLSSGCLLDNYKSKATYHFKAGNLTGDVYVYDLSTVYVNTSKVELKMFAVELPSFVGTLKITTPGGQIVGFPDGRMYRIIDCVVFSPDSLANDLAQDGTFLLPPKKTDSFTIKITNSQGSDVCIAVLSLWNGNKPTIEIDGVVANLTKVKTS